MGKKEKIHLLIGLAIYVVFAFLVPPVEPLTKEGVRVLGVFLMTVYWWTTLSVGWPSVICLYMLATTGITSASDVLAKSWGNGMTPFLCFCFLLNYAMAETGLSRRMALWFVTRKFVRGRPWLIMSTFLFSVCAVSLVVTSSAVGAMFLGIAEQMFENTGYKPGEKLPEATVASIAWVAQAGQGMTPMSHAVTLLVIGLVLSTFGVTVTVLTFSIGGLIFGAVFFVLFMLGFRFLMRPDVEKMRNLDIDYLKSTIPPMNQKERIVTIAFLVLIGMWVLPDIFNLVPLLAPVGGFLGKMGAYMPALLVVAVLCVIKVDGQPVINLAEASKKINWVSVYMMAALMCLATIVGMENGGITKFIEVNAGAILKGLPALVFVFIAVAWILVQTNFMSNTVSGVMFSALVPVGMAIPGVNPIALGLCIGAAANFGFATPAACPVVGMVASTDWVRTSYLLKYGWLASIAGLVTLVGVAYPIWCMVFPM